MLHKAKEHEIDRMRTLLECYVTQQMPGDLEALTVGENT